MWMYHLQKVLSMKLNLGLHLHSKVGDLSTMLLLVMILLPVELR